LYSLPPRDVHVERAPPCERERIPRIEAMDERPQRQEIEVTRGRGRIGQVQPMVASV